MDTPLSNRSMSTITTVALSRTQSYTYPLTQVSNGATTSSSPPTSLPSNSFLSTKLTRRSRAKQHKHFNSLHINIEMSDLTLTRPDNQALPNSTDVGYDGDDEDNGADMEIIRQDSEEKWKGNRSRSGSASVSGSTSTSVMGGVKRTVVKMGVSMRNGFRGLVRKFTF
ncbi:hypothetical protein COCC4DRAFT_59586 [Bipolaris maydis ATCC 48331]|uniref:Uncharacterized protein n=2 Tax=Cochliobolus heterostrophus TaxID=5016 RepID=M2UE42_COCH5|nr:uncharacterized protein COCC4DRAFT_59586 [Bipolaris maydis ATCC 48331]EMD86162.1 hypothetical protein COCHEDRAFT_21623 [Bipolaris maydis C5]ENI06111.1 hypothetical protein COCC4DRAFT_59586 [Bipolaris maydis ATCC 48331]KAH7551612.1 hypothetical protein BM1_09246 [Bipolaris maydis]